MGVSRTTSGSGKVQLVDLDSAGVDSMPCCGIKSATHPGRRQKLCWLRENAKYGVRAKTLLAPNGQPAGYIEYIPGKYAWRGVNADGYMFIHCIWMHSRQYQRKGFASLMVRACLDDAKNAGFSGVAAMVREGPWMADRRLFLANGFEPVDTAPPDYELLVHKFDAHAANPTFCECCPLDAYGDGLTIVRSSQCPYTAKFSAEIAEAAEKEYHIRPRIIDLNSWKDARNAPTPYAVFAVIYNGQLLADHQISRTRFRNIMNQS